MFLFGIIFSFVESKEKMTFAGHELIFTKLEDEVYIECKNVIGTYSDIMAFKNRTSVTGVYQFGNAMAKQRGRNFIQVGCLMDSLAKVDEIIKNCEKLKKESNE